MISVHNKHNKGHLLVAKVTFVVAKDSLIFSPIIFGVSAVGIFMVKAQVNKQSSVGRQSNTVKRQGG